MFGCKSPSFASVIAMAIQVLATGESRNERTESGCSVSSTTSVFTITNCTDPVGKHDYLYDNRCTISPTGRPVRFLVRHGAIKERKRGGMTS